MIDVKKPQRTIHLSKSVSLRMLCDISKPLYYCDSVSDFVTANPAWRRCEKCKTLVTPMEWLQYVEL